MAGGPFAATVSCVTCALQGEVVRADRIAEGLENDRYRCERDHESLVDWSRGAPTAPCWPPSDEERAMVARVAEALRARR